jgi:hypothetical protein
MFFIWEWLGFTSLHSSTLVGAWILQHSHNPLPFSCLNFYHKLKARVMIISVVLYHIFIQLHTFIQNTPWPTLPIGSNVSLVDTLQLAIGTTIVWHFARIAKFILPKSSYLIVLWRIMIFKQHIIFKIYVSTSSSSPLKIAFQICIKITNQTWFEYSKYLLNGETSFW